MFGARVLYSSGGLSGGFEVLERVLDDLVVGHSGAGRDEPIGGIVAELRTNTVEGAGAGGGDEWEVADVGERATGERTDEHGCGFGPSDPDENAVTPVERSRKGRACAQVAGHDHGFEQG